MEERNENTAVRFGVLTEILTRLEELTPDQYIVPDVARESDAHFVATASEDIKRLHTLRVILASEYEKIVLHQTKLAREAAEYIKTKNAAALDEESTMPSSRFSKLKAGVERTDQNRRLKGHFAKIINEMFWLEVKRQHSDLQGPVDICVYADWSLCWKESEREIPHGLIGIIAISPDDVEVALGGILGRGRLN